MSNYNFGVNGCKLTQEQIEAVISFHGHYCVGLSFGLRVGDWVFREFGRAEDEELVAAVETDMCAVDAIQFLVGCTFGKGNLIFLDYGKNVYSFFRRSNDKNVRISPRVERDADGTVSRGFLYDLSEQQKKLDPEDADGRKRIRELMIDRVMRTDFDRIFSITPARIPMPEKARIYQSQPCAKCGELVMLSRLTNNLCKECS
ncbi:MAG: FmdE family protein [Planctomycetaceae bacterium]|jgi:formylmethanofuran dehydrogenase subunit E|nr:FmdE family protein [Planctomycetaceae bacterium]